jgi:hypothetical protein
MASKLRLFVVLTQLIQLGIAYVDPNQVVHQLGDIAHRQDHVTVQ